ncbi:hypothetical protein CSOJ01_01099 [Colletotrichum sojae]|uniref:Uncharacterized protein n=1 Tax=Colletotrichum sojae TaxID=2175907 RepID=A0A8H6JWK9_9PEZI|nr:hypothetical protein CSOJ01_01099 [Colletotrichum sojae]
MSTYRTDYRDRDRDRDRRYDRDPYNYHDRRDGERDRRDRDYDRDYGRGSRDRERSRSRSRDGRSRDQDTDRPGTSFKTSTASRETAPRPPQRTLSSPSYKTGASTGSSPPPPPPPTRKPPTILTTPSSSAPSTPRISDGSTHVGKIAEALRTVSKRTSEHASIQVRKEVIEARAKAREQDRKISQSKYTEYPSLKESHRKTEKKDLDDLAALRKDEQEADKRTLVTTEQLASTLFQILSEVASKDGLGTVDSLEARFNARLGALEAKHREEAERQEKRIQELSKDILAEANERMLLSTENETLKARLRDVERKGQAYRQLVDEHTTSIRQLQTSQAHAGPAQAIPDPAVHAQHADELKMLQIKVAAHEEKLGDLDVDLINESCEVTTTTLPRCEANVKKAMEDIKKAHEEAKQAREEAKQAAEDIKKAKEEAKKGTDEIASLRKDAKQLRSQLEHTSTLVEARRKDQENLRYKIEKLQNNKQPSTSSGKLEAGVEQLRSDFSQLNSEMEKIRRSHESMGDTKQLKVGVEQLRSDFGQLNSEVEKIQTSQQSSADTEQLRAEVNQLQSDVKDLKSEMEQLRTRAQLRPEGDTFVTAKRVKALNDGFLKAVGQWVDELKARTKALEDHVAHAQHNPNPDVAQTSDKPSAVTESATLETMMDNHDERIRVLESSAQAQEQSAKVSRDEERSLLEKKQAAFEEAMLAMIETMKTQVAMSEQSLKSVSESVKLMTDNQSAQTGRLGEVESEMLKLGTRLESSEQSIRSAEEKLEKRMDLVQHNYMSLDSQMNNLTTDGLFQAIVRHLDKYQPSGAQLGQKVDTIIQQVTQHEHRLVKVERSSSTSEEPAHKKRKFSPNDYAITNGIR